MSNETKYQVFVSSTYTDLIEARSAAINTVLESYNFPVGMELFGADNDEQWTIIRELIDSSDFYILILGHRYGSISKDDGISFTEKEFDYAVSKGLKLLCFVRNGNVATHPHERDANTENVEKLEQFRQKVLTDRLCEFWDTVDDLKHKISSSLYKNMRKHGGVGWVRGNQVSGQLAEELAKLSEENRKLREENELLKQKFTVREPVLKVFLNDIAIDKVLNEDAININFPLLKEENKFKLPCKRIKQDYPSELAQWHRTISKFNNVIGVRSPEEYYEAYNKDIDEISDSDIEKHNHSLQLMEQLNSGMLELTITIENQGTSLATDIDMVVEVPDFIQLIDNNSKLNVDKYTKSISESLIHIETPEERAKKVVEYNFISPIILKEKNFKMPYLKNDYFLDGKNKIHVNLDSLLHYKNKIINGLYLFPLKHGSGVINIQLICAEYSHPQNFEIQITVE
ncbi:DUF4062 domain-containing protein [Acinetobacter haemolyticus]|uniref:DUF4062 domain-containing protein n=1 Tax=Acinetobacter haemolyticus TaxID=29430 RepID=UPI003D1B50D4